MTNTSTKSGEQPHQSPAGPNMELVDPGNQCPPNMPTSQASRRDSGQEWKRDVKTALLEETAAHKQTTQKIESGVESRKKDGKASAVVVDDAPEQALGPVIGEATKRGGTRYEEERRAAMRANGGYRDGWLVLNDPSVNLGVKADSLEGPKQSIGTVMGEGTKVGDGADEKCRREAMRKGGGYCDGWLMLN